MTDQLLKSADLNIPTKVLCYLVRHHLATPTTREADGSFRWSAANAESVQRVYEVYVAKQQAQRQLRELVTA